MNRSGWRDHDWRLLPDGAESPAMHVAIVERLREAFQARTGGVEHAVSADERFEAERRARGLFGNGAWTYRVP